MCTLGSGFTDIPEGTESNHHRNQKGSTMTSRHNSASRRNRTAALLSVDGLEVRLCLSTSATQLADGTLVIQGDNRVNRFDIVDDGLGTVGVIGRINRFGDGAYEDVNGDFDVLFSGVTRIEVETRGGSDWVRYRLSDSLDSSRTVNLDLGSGNDTAIVDVGTVRSADLVVNTFLGSGNDRYDAALLGDLLDAFVQMDVDGGSGNDDIAVASNLIALDGDSKLDMILDGASGRDQVNVEIDLDDVAFGLLNIDARGGSGNDFIGLNAYGVQNVRVDSVLIADGGTGRDRYSVTPEVDLYNF